MICPVGRTYDAHHPTCKSCGAICAEKLKENKYRAQPMEVDGIRFPSKREARYYVELKARVHLGEVLYFLRQVQFHLPGGVRYVVDFMLVMCDGSIRYVDTKGYKTETFKIKRKMVESLYPVKIELA